MMELKKLKISIIGCGWLGLPLCERLKSLGYEVLTSASTSEKQQKLAQSFKTFLFDIQGPAFDPQLIDCDVLIYTIPPLEPKLVDNFFKRLNPDQKCIFISSTSVYGKSQGPCNEGSPRLPESKNGKILVETETLLRSYLKNLTIIRPAGLYGEDRHPINILQGRSGLTNGEELTHLVHRNDCISALEKIIQLDIWNEDFNLINDCRIKKSLYYTEAAKSRGLIPPLYITDPNVIFLNATSLSNQKSKKLLSLTYAN